MTAQEVLVGAVIGTGYLVWAYNHPYRPCPSCKGSGRKKGSTSKRWGKCRRCKGSREVKTIGSQLLHRMTRSIVKYRKEK